MKTFILGLLTATLSLLVFNSVNAQTTKTAPASTPAADFSTVEGKICRGYYNQAEGGSGSLARPESAFKTMAVQNGHFTLLAIKAAPGASQGWDTASGNTYWKQGDTEFKVQPNGSWFFPNPAASSRYYLTQIASNEPGVVVFTVRYEADTGWAAGKAKCTAK